MSQMHKKAQKIVNEVDQELGIALVAYSNQELQFLKDKIELLLDTGVDIDELHDADDDDAFYEEDDMEEFDSEEDME